MKGPSQLVTCGSKLRIYTTTDYYATHSTKFTMHQPSSTTINTIIVATLLVPVVLPSITVASGDALQDSKSVKENGSLSSHQESLSQDTIYCRHMASMIACDYKWQKQVCLVMSEA
nr:uncharacterized protein LOC128697781 [Cherax quadricarinatus]